MNEEIDLFQERLDEIDQSVQEAEKSQDLVNQQQLKEQQQEQEFQEYTDKPQGFGTEIRNAITGGVADTAASIATAPERALDMATGAMSNEDGSYDKNYKPDWDPIDNDAIVNESWYGKILRSGIHFGTMGLALVGAARLNPKLAGALVKAGPITRGAVVGGASMALSETAQKDDSISRALQDEIQKHNPNFEIPFATQDTDSPIVKTLKNVVEDMGMGAVIDKTLMTIGAKWQARQAAKVPKKAPKETIDSAVEKNLRRDTADFLKARGVNFSKLSAEDQLEAMKARAKQSKKYQSWKSGDPADDVVNRNKSVEDQTVEKGRQEMETPEYRAHKNKPIAPRHAGTPTSNGTPYKVMKQMDEIDGKWGYEGGSTDNLTTPAQLERMANASGIDEAVLKKTARDLLGDAYMETLLRDLRKNRKSFQEVFGNAMERMQEVMGRETDGMSAEEFWKPLTDRMKAETGDIGDGTSLKYWSTTNVVAADLINASLFKSIRDSGNAGLDLLRYGVDINDTDSLVKSLRDRLTVGLTNVKRSRYLISDQFANLDKFKGTRSKAVREKLQELADETKDTVNLVFQTAADNPSDEVLQGLLEAFSMSNKIRNFQDLDNYLRNRLLTKRYGVVPTGGALIKELQSVMIHSILSGPKTIARALMGTSTVTFLRPTSTAVGAFISGDKTTLRASLAGTKAFVEMIPEAFTLFKTNLNKNFSTDMATIRTRFSEYSSRDEQWELLGWWAENRGSAGDQAAYRIADVARSLNDSRLLTYSTRTMASIDDTFAALMGRVQARQDAYVKLIQDGAEITPQRVKEAGADIEAKFFDGDGNITDEALKFRHKENTLTQELTGFGQQMNNFFESQPLIKPFFLFARTGVNGFNLALKHTPVFNRLVKEVNDINAATVDDLADLIQYGIRDEADLMAAKALNKGRVAIGYAVTMGAVGHYLNGGLTGNGPLDRAQRQLWIDAGWKPRSIKLGDVWVSYDSFEPFNSWLATIADIGDNMYATGPEYAQNFYQRMGIAIVSGQMSKTYMGGLQQLNDLFSQDPKALSRIAANLVNNTVPLGGLRNTIGQTLNPVMRELGSSFEDHVRNRNLATEGAFGTKALPAKFDMLNGEKIRDWDPLTRLWNAVSPVNFNLDQGPGRQMLYKSGYDMRLSTYSTPTNVSLANSPEVRSMYQEAIGKFGGLEAKLDELSKRKDVQASIERMRGDALAGYRDKKPESYLHIRLISDAFQRAKQIGWAKIQDKPEVKALVRAKQAKDAAAARDIMGDYKGGQEKYEEYQELINLQNK